MLYDEARLHPFGMDRSRESFDSDEITAAGSDTEISPSEKEGLLAQPLDLSSHFPSCRHLASSVNLPAYTSLSRSIAWALIPSFLGRRAASPGKTETSSIAALDGLRGLACLFVFNEHLTLNFSDTPLWGYGTDGRTTLAQLPFIRVMWSGFSMVSIFFVISGYVLSCKPLKQIRARDASGFHKTLASSVLRRAFRLYLPTIIAIMICGLLVSLGAFDRASLVYNTDDNYLGLHEAPPPILDSFGAQMYDTAKHALQMLNFWDWTDDLSASDYDLHTWTIAVEFRSSMVLFLLLLGTSRLKQIYRLLTCVFFISFSIFYGRREVLLFTSGMLLAEIDLMRKSDEASPLPTTARSRISFRRASDSSLAWLIIFIAGLYLCSVPVFGSEGTFGFQTLVQLVPSCFPDKATFVRCEGAILVTWASANSEFIKPLFTNRFSLYLGKISFALYLVHGNVLKSLLFSAMPTILSITNDGTKNDITMFGMVASWALGALLVLPVTFWLSDLFCRGVDVPCVKFARWIEVKVCEEDGPRSS